MSNDKKPERKSTFVKNQLVEILAIMLFHEDGVYGASWLSIQEGTRNRYRAIAAGQKELPNNLVNRRTSSGFLED